ENIEDLFVVDWVDPDPIVFDEELDPLFQGPSSDFNTGMGLTAHKLGRVCDQVLEQLIQLNMFKRKSRKRGMNYHVNHLLLERSFINIKNFSIDLLDFYPLL